MLDPIDDTLLLIMAMLCDVNRRFSVWTNDGRHIGRERHVFFDLCVEVVEYTNHRRESQTET